MFEPCFGSGVVLLRRPHEPKIETVNDIDAFVVNVFRALRADASAVVEWCNWPVMEAHVDAIQAWLVSQRRLFTSRLMGDPEYYDTRVAGWWLYGVNAWIGGGWCSGDGPWVVRDGMLQRGETHEPGIRRKIPVLSGSGQGTQRRLPYLSEGGRGVHKESGREALLQWFEDVQRRLRFVRVTCGDAMRVLSPAVTVQNGLTGILIDPPYGDVHGWDRSLYAHDDKSLAARLRAWCVERGSDPLLRIVLCGLGEEHDELLQHGWTKTGWVGRSGYAGQRKHGDANLNRFRENLWCSPACLPITPARQLDLFPF